MKPKQEKILLENPIKGKPSIVAGIIVIIVGLFLIFYGNNISLTDLLTLNVDTVPLVIIGIGIIILIIGLLRHWWFN